MHDLDRQQLEQYEQEGLLGEYAIGELTEAQEMELASQFLEVASEEELEEFLGNLAGRVGRGLTAAKRATGKAFVANPGAVNNVIRAVKTVGPLLSGAAAIGSGLPPDEALKRANQFPALVDWAAGGLKNRMQQWSNLELEGLSGEDREFEIARRYIRFAIDALQRALEAPPRVPQPVAAQIAVAEAARAHAPGLVPFVPELVSGAAGGNGANGGESSGRWVRQGSSIAIDLG